MKDLILVIWKSPQGRNYVIGEIEKSDYYYFRYSGNINDARAEGFELLIPFQDIDATYKSEKLFPIFATRLPDKKRPDIENILRKYNMSEYDELMLLKNGAELPTDNLKFAEKIAEGKMRVFEFEQLGKQFRVELEYEHSMSRASAWVDRNNVEIGAIPLETGSAKVYVDGEMIYDTNSVSEFDLTLSKETRIIDGHEVRTVHNLRLRIIDPEVWEQYEAWLNKVVDEGTTDEVKEYLEEERKQYAAEKYREAQEIIRLAEQQRDLPTREEVLRRQKKWNDIYNEGGEGYIPIIITKAQYESAREIVRQYRHE